MFIKEVKGDIIKNSRNEKTVHIEIDTYHGKFWAAAPSGKSKGKHERPDYNEFGIQESLKLLKIFAEHLKNNNFNIKKFEDLEELEKLITRFENKFGKLGANVTYALETAFLKAAAKENKKELWEFVKGNWKAKIPMPVGNCIGGGKHSKGDKKPEFQEFLLIPKEESFSRAITKNLHAYNRAKSLLKKKEKKWFMSRNDESAWHTSLNNEEVLDILRQVADEFDLRIGMDVAASSFYFNGWYMYKNKKLRNKREQIDYLKRLINKYKIFYIEDPVQEEDFNGFYELKTDNKKSLIVGDDLTVTTLQRVNTALGTRAINAIIVKPNQIGSMIEVRKVVELCKKKNIRIIFSHRSGETMDDALADYAVGFGADFIKTGIHGRERMIKLRRIVEIEKSLK